MGYVYKILYPNGKIYVGSDVTDTVGYFGSPSNKQINDDFPLSKHKRLTIEKEILFHQSGISREELVKIEMDYIRKLNSNDPDIGYNLYPRS
ncbi:MAG TPA: GIY-YIG nuclease family protein [Caldisericia bacterium]|nr:GIY-YIG nuclease family protein [Caldisericia bacterium]